MTILIQTVSALAAAGKTYSAIAHTSRHVRSGERYIIVVPSTLLVEQIATDYRNAGCPRVTAYHSADDSGLSVSGRLTKHFQTTDYNLGEIVVMTWAAFERLPYIERRSDWNLLIDEAPSPIFHERFSLHENRGHLLRLLHVGQWNAAYSLLGASEEDTGHVHDAAQNRHEDQFTQQLTAFANLLLSQHWRCLPAMSNLRRSVILRMSHRRLTCSRC